MKAGQPEPTILLHPDDIVIDERTGVRFVGPQTVDELKAAKNTKRLIEAILLQEALDRRRNRTKGEPDLFPEDALTTTMVLNASLCDRLAFTQNELSDMCMELRSITVRELLRGTHLASKATGMPTLRGATAMPPSVVLSILQMSAEMLDVFIDDEKSKAEKNTDIDTLTQRHFG